MKSSFRLGRLFGIELGVNYSWFIIFFLITASLALQYFPGNYPRWPGWAYWPVGAVASLLFFASVVAHELAHSVISQRQGIPVREITLFIFGGVSHITQEAVRPRDELVMALAGPLSSLGLAFLSLLIALMAAPLGLPQVVGAVAAYLALVNTLLALFNLIPGFPLDGGRVLRAAIWGLGGDFRRATRIASWSGRGIAYLFIVVGILAVFVGFWVNGLWLMLIGWFLESAASGSYQQMVLRELLTGYTARDLMSQDYAWVSPELPLGSLVREHILRTSRRSFLVGDNQTLLGIVTLHNVKAIPQERWEVTTVSEAMTPREKLHTASPQDTALAILERMDMADINQMPVVSGGVVVGMVARDSLLRLIRTRSDLKL